MRKFRFLLVIMAMAAVLAACGGPDSDGSASAEADSAAKADGNILIVYFTVAENSQVDAVSSASAIEYEGEYKGNVRVLAELIQDEVGGELYSIRTSTEYPADIYDVIAYTTEYEGDDVRPELTNHIDNFDEYDTIFVGYSIWNLGLPRVMYSFFDEYDFSGKTILPFCSHNGSRLSDTVEEIRRLEPDATVTEGLPSHFENVLNASGDIKMWLQDVM